MMFTSFVKYNDKFEQNHDNYGFETINNENNYEITNFNDVLWELWPKMKLATSLEK